MFVRLCCQIPLMKRRPENATPGHLRGSLRSLLMSVCVTFFCALPSVSEAKNFALVVGIDEYDVVSDLAGAVNDAHWIAQSLAELGVSELTLLTNAQATRAAIKSAYFQYLDMAKRGDVLVFSFAGHGRPVRDHNGDEPTALDPKDSEDETLILAGFSRDNPGEEILDDELSYWFHEAQRKGVQVIFLADSCFSGTVSRGGRLRRVDDFVLDIPPLAPDVPTRGGFALAHVPPPHPAGHPPPHANKANGMHALGRPPLGTPAKGHPPSPAGRPHNAAVHAQTDTLVRGAAFDENPDNLIFLSGAPETEPVQEIMVNGRFHGALSYSFGVALKGMRGDIDSDGQISRDELSRYLIRAVRGHNDGRALPTVVAKLGQDFPILTPDPEAREFDIVMPPANGYLDASKKRDIGEVSLSYRPDLSWNEASGDISNLQGETVAQSVDLSRLPEVEAKFEILALAREALTQRAFDVAFSLEDGTTPEALMIGTAFEIEVGPVPYPYLTIFNLANNGEVQLLYPLDNSERRKQKIGSRQTFSANASAPAGIDHVIAFSTKEDPVALRQQLNWNMQAEALIATVDRLSLQDGVAVGIVSLATFDKPLTD